MSLVLMQTREHLVLAIKSALPELNLIKSENTLLQAFYDSSFKILSI